MSDCEVIKALSGIIIMLLSVLSLGLWLINRELREENEGLERETFRLNFEAEEALKLLRRLH